ncbi:MAG: hypothetical protein J6Y99_08500 [Bacteroidales bacterium]|nr:hypothetical protein [Bacteroidales bacterium]
MKKFLFLLLIAQSIFGTLFANNPNTEDEEKSTELIKTMFDTIDQVSVFYQDNQIIIHSSKSNNLSMVITKVDNCEQQNYSFEVENLVTKLNLNLEEGKYNVTIFSRQDSYITSIEVF